VRRLLNGSVNGKKNVISPLSFSAIIRANHCLWLPSVLYGSFFSPDLAFLEVMLETSSLRLSLIELRY
jgi:hypothetical protein